MPWLKSIAAIRGYKSFADYSWTKLHQRKDKAGNPIDTSLSPKFNLFFGENGAGKSAVVRILKSLSGQRDFGKSIPAYVRLDLDTGAREFGGTAWNSLLGPTDIVFFDSQFVNQNVHTHLSRKGTQGEHKQNSGRLLIEFDSQAIALRKRRDETKVTVSQFREKHTGKLSFSLTEIEREICAAHKETPEDQLQEMKGRAIQSIEDLDEELRRIARNRQQIDAIRTVQPAQYLERPGKLPTWEDIHALSVSNPTERALAEADARIAERVGRHPHFFQTGLEITEGDNCPYCGQSLKPEGVGLLLSTYRQVFGEQYKAHKRRLEAEVEANARAIEELELYVQQLPGRILRVVEHVVSAGTRFGIEEARIPAVNVEKATEHAEILRHSIALLNRKVQSISTHKPESIARDEYQNCATTLAAVDENVTAFNASVEKINGVIAQFKSKFGTDLGVQEEMKRVLASRGSAQAILDVVREGKIAREVERLECVARLAKLEEDETKAKKEYEHYLAETVPQQTILRMLRNLEHFRLKFRLEPDSVALGVVKEYPFSFRLIDEEGKERSWEDGLSEGEAQVVSLAFFFAYLEGMEPLAGKMVVFDDPVTSMDAANLKRLVDLIVVKCSGAQTLLFTHHPLFWKYCRKDMQATRFLVLKNKKAFGGSFVCYDHEMDVEERLKEMEAELKRRVDSGELDYSIFAMEYGHLLRYAIEHYIKNDMLFWNESNFEQVLAAVGKRSLTEAQCASILKIYKFCNYSNYLHVDREEPATLGELLGHINDFAAIRNPA